MVKSLFVLFDTVSGVLSDPYSMPNLASFLRYCRDDTYIGKHSSDYLVFAAGSFDSVSGVLKGVQDTGEIVVVKVFDGRPLDLEQLFKLGAKFPGVRYFPHEEDYKESGLDELQENEK